MLLNMDCMDWLDQEMERVSQSKVKTVKAVFMDPPDNLGLKYADDSSGDKNHHYYTWLESLILKSMAVSQLVWVSYYWEHDLELKYMVRNLLRFRHPMWGFRLFLWRFTFSQYNPKDCAIGFRPILRLAAPNVVLDPGAIRIESMRQILGDPRANPEGRVPDSVWDHPRVVGNASERRAWHPTQHPEALMKRIISLSAIAESESFVDLFAGTGTSLRCCRDLGINCISTERSPTYYNLIREEMGS